MKKLILAIATVAGLGASGQRAMGPKPRASELVRVRVFATKDVYDFKFGGGALRSIWFRGDEAPDTLVSSNVHVRRSEGLLVANADGTWRSADSIRVEFDRPLSTEGPSGVRRTYPGGFVALPLGRTELLVVNRVPIDD